MEEMHSCPESSPGKEEDRVQYILGAVSSSTWLKSEVAGRGELPEVPVRLRDRRGQT